MRCFLVSMLLFSFVFSSQAVFAQTQDFLTAEAERYYFAESQFYKRGVSQAITANSAVVQGQIFQPASGGFYVPISGVELSLVGGDDFMSSAVSDANGYFAFEPAAKGEYTIVAHTADANALGSVTVSLSSVTKSADATRTNFLTDSLQLVFEVDNNELYILGKNRVIPEDAATATKPVAHGGASAGGASAGGAFANGGLLLAGLGAAGLATGIAALADDDDRPFDPVTVGAPTSR